MITHLLSSVAEVSATDQIWGVIFSQGPFVAMAFGALWFVKRGEAKFKGDVDALMAGKDRELAGKDRELALKDVEIARLNQERERERAHGDKYESYTFSLLEETRKTVSLVADAATKRTGA